MLFVFVFLTKRFDREEEDVTAASQESLYSDVDVLIDCRTVA